MKNLDPQDPLLGDSYSAVLASDPEFHVLSSLSYSDVVQITLRETMLYCF